MWGMAPRAISSATIAFGLVNIPIKLYSTSNPSSSISFKMLTKDGGRVKQQYVDPKNGDAVVPRSEMVKGYEFAKDQYVLFTNEEIKELQEKATQTVEITEFVPEDQVPKEYYAKTYYLGAEKGGDRAYVLLSEAMKRAGRVAIAKYAARGKQYLVLIAPKGDGLAMHQLHYPDELQSFTEVPLPDVEVKESEVALAMQLIDQIASDTFNPQNYEDEVRKRMEAVIQQKIEGADVTLAPEESPKAQIIDLMDALKASLDGGEGAAEPEPEKAEPKTKKKTAKSSK